MKKDDRSITVSPFYQRLFTGAALWGWLAAQIILLRQFSQRGSYVNGGTWTFQITMWVFPVVFFALSLWFAVKRYAYWRQRFFFSMLLTVAGLSIYDGIMSVEQYFYINYYTRNYPITGQSYWASFGNDWTMMLIGVALFAGALLWLRKRKV